MSPTGDARHVWSVVLAGGEGVRTRPLIERWLGRPVPKQYCTFVGRRSMLQHTLDRADRLSPPHQKVTVVAREHRLEAWAQLNPSSSGTVLLQPRNCETAPGIFLPLTYIRARDPQATVVLYPSDHFVFPEQTFAECIQRAVAVTDRFPDRLVLLGVPPDGPETDYGWVLPGSMIKREAGLWIRSVRRFLEKPDPAQAEQAWAFGGLWNTLIIVARLELLWTLGRLCVPEVVTQFERLEDAIGSSSEIRVLEDIYRAMPRRNFSTDVLEQVPESIVLIELRDVIWSDWGRPERIVSTLRRIGKEPAFPSSALQAASNLTSH